MAFLSFRSLRRRLEQLNRYGNPLDWNAVALRHQPPRNVGTRAFALGGAATAAMNAVNPSTGLTTTGQYNSFGQAMEISAKTFHAVRVILCSVNAATQVLRAATAQPLASMLDSTACINNANAASATPLLFNGTANDITIPAGTASSPGLLVSDWLRLSSIDRTDGGTTAAISLRIALTTGASGAATPMSYWNRSGSDWTAGAGKVFSYTTNTVGDFTAASMTGAFGGFTGNSPIFGVQYLTDSGVETHLFAGDSITGGMNLTNYKSRPSFARACFAVSSPTRPVEPAIFGVSGAGVGVYQSWLDSAYAGTTGGTTGIKSGATNMEVLNPTHMMFQAFTPNTASTSTITAAQIATLRQYISLAEWAAQKSGVIPTLWGGIPRNTGAAAYYDSSDSLRKSLLADLALKGVLFSDFGNAAIGDNATPQRIQMIANGYAADLSNDGLHPNDAGDVSMLAGLIPFIAAQSSAYLIAP